MNEKITVVVSVVIVLLAIGLISQIDPSPTTGSSLTSAVIGINSVVEKEVSQEDPVLSVSSELGIQATGDANTTWNISIGGGYSIEKMAFDSNYNLYITGLGPGDTWWISKFFSNGTHDVGNWNKSYSATEAAGTAIVIDSNDNIFVGGYGTDLDGTSGIDWWIKKFNTTGSENTTNWNLNATSVGENEDILLSLALDSNNTLYAVGYGQHLVGASSNGDWWVKKFFTNGTEDVRNWNRSFNTGTGEDYANDIAIDSDNNVYVVGFGGNLTNNGNANDWWIKRLNTSGHDNATHWNLSFSSNDSLNDRPRAVALDTSDNVYVGGFKSTSRSATDLDWWLKKIYSNGSEDLNWNLTFHMGDSDAAGSDDAPYETIHDLVIDGNDNVYAVGSGNFTLQPNWWIKKFNSSGSEDVTLWNKTFSSSTHDDAYGAVLDANANLFIGGYTDSLGTSIARIRLFEGVNVMNLTLVSPATGYTNITHPVATVNFSCNASDTQGLTNISLYLTDNANASFALNQSTSVTGTFNETSWNVDVREGNYTWGCLAYDTDDNLVWSENRTVQNNFGCGYSVTTGITLVKNLTAAGDCLNMTVSNVIIDGSGYYIIGNGTGRGIFSESDNVASNITIKNFAGINNFTSGFDSGAKANNLTIINNSFTTAADIGDNYYVEVQYNNTLITNNTFFGISANAATEVLGILGFGFFNVTIINNTFNLSDGNVGLSYESTIGGNITGNIFVSTSSGVAISMAASSQNVSYITNNIFTLDGNGAAITALSKVFVDSNNITTAVNGTIVADDSINSTFQNNNILVNNSGSAGFSLQYQGTGTYPTGNRFINNNITVLAGSSFSDTTNTSCVSDLIYNNSVGEIVWDDYTNLTSNLTLDINSTIFLVNNTVGLIDNAEFINLNGSATIKMFALNYTYTPRLLKGGVRCDNTNNCNITYNATTGILVANVTSFSNYTTTGNQLPNTIEVILNTTSVNNLSTDVLTCYANISDADDTIIYANYTWYNNSVLFLTGQSGNFTQSTVANIANISAANLTNNDTWICEVFGDDTIGYETDKTNSSALTILQGCGTITESTTLIANVTYNGTSSECFSYVANNSVFDCNSYWLVGPDNSSNAGNTAIQGTGGLFNATIKNCNIKGFSGVIMDFNGGHNNTIINNNFTKAELNTTGGAIYLRMQSTDSNVSNNRFENYHVGIGGDSGVKAIELNNTENNSFIGFNYISNMTSDGSGNCSTIQTGAAIFNATIINNDIRDSACSSATLLGAIYNDGANSFIQNNILNNTNIGILAFGTGNTLINNTIYNLVNGILYGHSSVGTAASIISTNNTFINVTTCDALLQSTGVNISNQNYSSCGLEISVEATQDFKFLDPVFTDTFFVDNASNVTYNNLSIGNATTYINFLDLSFNQTLVNLSRGFSYAGDWIFVNATLNSALNVSANITLNRSYASNAAYRVLRDGAVCSDCTELGFDPVRFEVTGFSNYTVEAVTAAAAAAAAASSSGSSGSSSGWGICGDGLCNDGETCAAEGINNHYGGCNLDCGMCPSEGTTIEEGTEERSSESQTAEDDYEESASPGGREGPVTGQAFFTNVKDLLTDYSYLWIAIIVLIVLIIGGVYVGKTVYPRHKKRKLIKKTKTLKKKVAKAKNPQLPKHVLWAHKRAFVELLLTVILLAIVYFFITTYWTQIIQLGNWLIPIVAAIISIIVILILSTRKKKAIIVKRSK